jgi:tetraacyldisaccharide 4'-kinase
MLTFANLWLKPSLQGENSVWSFKVSWKALVEGQAGFVARWTLAPLLTTLTYPCDWAHKLRLQAYRQGWTPVRRLPCRVISVGNLTLGGTGKTPMVESVASFLQQEGLRVGVLSRGYGGRQSRSPTIVSDGKKCLVPPEVAGDEPVLLAEHLAGVPVVVGKDRYAAGMLAVEHFSDAVRPFGNDRLFPRGDLREGPAAIARANAVVLTCWEAKTVPSLTAVKLLQPTLPLFCSQHEPVDLRALADGHTMPLASLKGQPILAFCGIGTPDHFRQTLQRLGAEVVAFAAFPDHHPYSRPEVEQLILLAKQHSVEILVTTEKDGMRLRRLQPLMSQMWALRVRTTIVEGEAAWKTCILGAMKG